MPQRRLLPMFGLAAVATTGWFTWDGPDRPAHAALVQAVPAEGTGPGMSEAEYRYRHSQSAHWRALMLKR